MPKLIVSGAGEEGRVLEFGAETVTLGRDEGNTIRLNDPGAEPRHCQIEPAPDGRFKIVDLETKAGTSVNGSKVNAHLLSDNDRIDIGRCSIVFREGQEDRLDDRTQQIRAIRTTRRRARKFGRRRVVLPPPQQGQKVFTYEDLRLVIASLIEENGPAALDEIRRALDQAYEEHRGSPLVASLMEERDGLYRIAEINKLINSEHNLKKLLELIMDTVIELASAERGFLILKERDSLAIKVARNFDRESIRKPEFKVSHSVAEGVIRTGRPVLSADALNDPAFAASTVSDLKLRSLLCIPFRVRDLILGCVYIDNRFEAGVFIEDDLPLLQAFADQAAIAIENARLFEENLLRQEELRRSKEEIERLNAELREKVEKQYAELAKVTQDLLSSRRDFEPRHDFSHIVGKSRALRETFYVLDKVIDTDEPVFVHGESGTGKELVARAIHFNSARARSGRFVSENCSAIPDTLLESELFGHEKGAFTGAVASKPGLFEQAHKGTLFLDEIGDMSLDMQKKLLRAIQEKEIRRVGGQDIVRVDVRIISASNKDLADLIRAGRFREDLFYRLNVVKIALPPLRDRKEDIPLLVEHFLQRIAREQNQPLRRIDETALRYLQNYSWPGNVRELENELRRAVALSEDTITADQFKDEIRSRDLFRPAIRIPAAGALKEIVREAIEDVERKVILKALEESGWKKSEAARNLGISRPTLDAKIDAYNLTRSHPVTE